MAKKQSLNFKQSLIVFVLGFGGLFLLVKSGLIERGMGKLMAPLAPPNMSEYAARRAVVIKPIPECQVFHQQVAEAGKGPNASATTIGRISEAIEAARVAGCTNTN